MALGQIIDLADLPFLTKGDLGGRFLCTSTFYDGSWRTWLAIEEDGRKLIEVQAWPAEYGLFRHPAGAAERHLQRVFDLRRPARQLRRVLSAVLSDPG